MATVAERTSPAVENSIKCTSPDLEEDSGVDNSSESGVSTDDDLKEFSSNESVNLDSIKSFTENDIYELSADEIINNNKDTCDILNEEPKINLEKLTIYFRTLYEGKQESFDPYVPFDKKPPWYNEDKFKRGQQFAMNHLFCINYAETLSLFLIFSLDSALEPLIFTDRSHTPYKAFERYLSTLTRVMAWYEGDPWKEGSTSQRQMVTVRAMHRNVQTQLTNSSAAELRRRITLNGRCPMWSTIQPAVKTDFQSACPVPAPGACPLGTNGLWINQFDMAITQLAFVGMAVTYPNKFGIHDATDEDLDSFLHLWRTLGYLLGIQDKYNYCNADLEAVRERTLDFINIAVKPALRNVSADWEHMCRCLVRGVAFYVPGFTFEVSLAHLCSILNIHTPRLNQSLSIWNSFMYKVVELTFNVLCRMPIMLSMYNRHMLTAINSAKNASPETLKQWEQTEFPYMKQNDEVNSS